MNWPRHHSHAPARPLFALLSVLALLAIACFPVFAQAESPEAVYEVDVPTADGETKESTTIPNPSTNPSDPSDANSSATEPGEIPTTEESGVTPAVSGDGDDDGNPSTDGDRGAAQPADSNGSPTALGQAKAVSKPVANNVVDSDDGGSSSPLVPILITLAVLAAISIGAFVYRQRRQDGTGQTSPKAS